MVSLQFALKADGCAETSLFKSSLAADTQVCFSRVRVEWSEGLGAREHARQKALAGIRLAGEAGDWRALEAFLRLSFQQDYRRDSNINVTATATTQQALVCDEPTRQRLIELRKQILGENKNKVAPALSPHPKATGRTS